MQDPSRRSPQSPNPQLLSPLRLLRDLLFPSSRRVIPFPSLDPNHPSKSSARTRTLLSNLLIEPASSLPTVNFSTPRRLRRARISSKAEVPVPAPSSRWIPREREERFSMELPTGFSSWQQQQQFQHLQGGPPRFQQQQQSGRDSFSPDQRNRPPPPAPPPQIFGSRPEPRPPDSFSRLGPAQPYGQDPRRGLDGRNQQHQFQQRPPPF